MNTLSVFVWALILFEGLIIRSEGKNPTRKELSTDLIADVLYRTDYETTKNAAHAEVLTEGTLQRLFNRGIIVIRSPPIYGEHKGVIDFEQEGERYLIIQNYDELMKLFGQFGEYARRIRLYYQHMSERKRLFINEKIIKKYASNLTELEIYTQERLPKLQNDRIWKTISNENGDIYFPNVKKFKFEGEITKNPFKMSSIFPKLEIFELEGSVEDTDFLTNLPQLKELTLTSESIGEDELVNIIANNTKLKKLKICNNRYKIFGIRTVQSIANLKYLKTLTVTRFGKEFFNRTANETYSFKSVTSFSVFGSIGDVYENVLFKMPNLKNLELAEDYINYNINRIINFINGFKKLETVYVPGLYTRKSMRFIESLTHVKEFTTDICETRCDLLSALKKQFQNFDEQKSNLKTLTWWEFDYSKYPSYQATMEKLNKHLKESKKPTWKISNGYVNKPGDNDSKVYYVSFQRDV